MGIDVVAGVLRPNTPICVPARNNIYVGVVESIEFNHKPLKEARKNTGSVGIRVKNE